MDRVTRRRGVTWPAAVVALALVALSTAACSSDEPSAAERSDAPTTTVASTVDRTCDQGATTPSVTAQPVEGIPSDWTVTSFDGTQIRTHWFPAPDTTADAPAPTVLMGPGWSLAGDTSPEGAVLFGALSIAGMNRAGYNVLTWDPRGFGESTGVSSVNDPDLEGRDVQVLIDWVSEQDVAQADADGDPRLGMVGFSYGGGIQLTVAAQDCRVDAIVPGLSWHSLETSLYQNETVKAGWAGVLTDTAATADLDPHIASAAASGISEGTLSAEDLDWFVGRGPGDAVADITAPTLFIQGTVDGLFPLDEAITNHRLLRDAGVPTAMVWFCGGHGTCLSSEGRSGQVTDATFAWLGRYVQGDESIDTGPGFETVDQDDQRWSAADYPVAAADPLTATGSGSLSLTEASVAGPATARPGSADPLAAIALDITPARAAEAVELTLDPGDVDGLALGPPALTLDYTGTTPDGTKPTRVFAQLVDDETGLVIDNQITPVPVTLDGEPHSVELPLEVIAHHITRGHTVTLQIVATTPAYATPRLGGQVTFDAIELSIPMADGIEPVTIAGGPR